MKEKRILPKNIKEVLEVILRLILLLIMIFTVPSLLVAVNNEPAVGIHYICIVISMILVMKRKTIMNNKIKLKSLKGGDKNE